MKIKNNVGPKIDHWGTPDFIYAGVDSPLPERKGVRGRGVGSRGARIEMFKNIMVIEYYTKKLFCICDTVIIYNYWCLKCLISRFTDV